MPLHKYNTIYYIFWDCTVHCRFSTAIFIFQSLLHKIMLTLRCAIQHDVMFITFFLQYFTVESDISCVEWTTAARFYIIPSGSQVHDDCSQYTVCCVAIFTVS